MKLSTYYYPIYYNEIVSKEVYKFGLSVYNIDNEKQIFAD